MAVVGDCQTTRLRLALSPEKEQVKEVLPAGQQFMEVLPAGQQLM